MTGFERLRNITDDLDRSTWTEEIACAIRDSLDNIEREQSEDHEIAEWVREHGGIEVVRNRDGFATDMLSWIRSVSEVPDEMDLVDVDEAMSDIDKRLMPPGYEWPRYEDGDNLKLGDPIIDDDELPSWREVDSIIFNRIEKRIQVEIENVRGVCERYKAGERVKRPKQDTITNPEPSDSWEQIEKDAKLKPFGYVSNVLGWDMRKGHSANQSVHAMTLDIVRRAKELAGREKADKCQK